MDNMKECWRIGRDIVGENKSSWARSIKSKSMNKKEFHKSSSPMLYIYLFFDFERERADEKLGLDCRVAVHHVHADVSVPAQSAKPVHGGPGPGRAVRLGGRRLKRHVTLSRGQDFGPSFTGCTRPGWFACAYRHSRPPLPGRSKVG